MSRSLPRNANGCSAADGPGTMALASIRVVRALLLPWLLKFSAILRSTCGMLLCLGIIVADVVVVVYRVVGEEVGEVVGGVVGDGVGGVGGVGDGVVGDGVGDVGDGVVGDGVGDVGDGVVGDGVGDGVGALIGSAVARARGSSTTTREVSGVTSACSIASCVASRLASPATVALGETAARRKSCLTRKWAQRRAVKPSGKSAAA